MYLSKLELNPRSHEARRDLALPYELHRTLARAFSTPNGQDYRATHGVLFRIEPAAGPGGRPVVLVQSVSDPDWAELPPNYAQHPVQCKPLLQSFAPEQILSFRLVANPTKKVTREGRQQGNRVALFDTGPADELTPAQQWLRRKAELSGFELLHVLSEGFRLTSTAGHQDKQRLPFYGVRFDGLLRVRDPHLLLDAIHQGIGPAKAFGFGLLSLAKPIT
jgi:CRISPR system Cascade subunit CasE